MRAWWIMLLALGGLWRRPLRALLTILGVTIAAGSLFSMVGFALGMQRQAEAPFEKLDLLKNIEIHVRSDRHEMKDPDDPDSPPSDDEEETDASPNSQGREEELLVLDDELLAKIQQMPDVAVAYPQFRLGNLEVRHGDKKQRCMAIGAPREVGLVDFGVELLVAGQFFDLGAGEPQVLLSTTVVEKLGFESPQAAVGQDVTLVASGLARRDDDAFEYRTKEVTATILGVYEPPTPAIGPLARTLLLPVDVMKDIPGVAFGMGGPHRGSNLPPRGYARAIVRVEHPSDLLRVEKRLKEMGLRTQTAVERLDELRTFFVFLDVLLAAVGTVALVVAALGIINTLLMSVLERYQEIGTYKAVGASDGDVVVLFLTEAVLLGFFGGLGGLALGRVVSWGLDIGINIYARNQGVDAPLVFFNFPLWLSLTTVAFATLIAIIAGVWPALRAARIDPIRALRGE